MTSTDARPELSICIVGINAIDYLRNCIASIYSSVIGVSYEIIYVDNHSNDCSIQILEEEFPQVKIIKNETNLGFSKANNQAIHISKGRLLLLLNPDTLVGEKSIQVLVDYLAAHPKTGIVGPKILNSDGSFQPHCKRGEARPWEVICYFFTLSQLFPHHPFFSGYLQGHLDENEINNVPAISGSCMLFRREVIVQIGLLDEVFFSYQEDTEYCFRARTAGWNVTYVPTAPIIHFGGKGGSRVTPYKSIYEWHRSYYLYYKKHLAGDYFFILNWFIYFLIGVKLFLSLMINLFRSEKYVGPKRG